MIKSCTSTFAGDPQSDSSIGSKMANLNDVKKDDVNIDDGHKTAYISNAVDMISK